MSNLTEEVVREIKATLTKINDEKSMFTPSDSAHMEIDIKRTMALGVKAEKWLRLLLEEREQLIASDVFRNDYRQELEIKIIEQDKEIQKYKAALEFYANIENWEYGYARYNDDGDRVGTESYVEDDSGFKAKQALSSTTNKE